MIKGNTRTVDVEALMRRVRDEAERLRSGRTLDEARRQRWNTSTNRLIEILDRENTIVLSLDAAESRNLPRTKIPTRLARLHGFGAVPVRLILRVFNYLFKQQREVNAAQNTALREMAALVVAAAADLTTLTKRVAELTDRLEQREGQLDKTP